MRNSAKISGPHYDKIRGNRAELERFYCHYVEVFNREDDGFFVYYAPIFQIVSSDGGLISVTNDARLGADYMKALFIEPMLLVTLLVRIVP